MALTPTPNMFLSLPAPSTELGPLWAQEINTAFTAVDGHDHSSGKGVAVSTAGLNVNADLSFQSNRALALKTVRFTSQASLFNSLTDRSQLYVYGNELYYQDGTGTNVQITNNGALGGSSGSILGMGGTTAAVNYSNALSTFTFTSNTNIAAKIYGASLSIAEPVTNGKAVTLQTVAGFVANYALTLPSALPASQSTLQSDASGNLSFVAVKTPTTQRFISTGTTTGYVFTISTSTTCAVGDTYTNNSNTYTVLGALSAQSGQILFCSGASAPQSSGTLTRSSGSGTASITFSAATALATYATPANVKWIRVRMVGGGGGGGAEATNAGSAGTSSFFGSNLLTASGGGGGAANSGSAGGGGSGSLGAITTGIAVVGSSGISGLITGTGGSPPGMPGGVGVIFGGTGSNSGAGGGGGSTGTTSGAGGGSGGGIDAIIGSPSAAYVFAVGTGGNGGTAGGAAGQRGVDGQVYIEEYY